MNQEISNSDQRQEGTSESQEKSALRATRIIAMGSSALAEGFALIGCEAWADAKPGDVERVLADILRRRESALVLLEPHLARCESPSLQQIYAEGGRVVVTEIPPLHAANDYHPQVEDLVASVLGSSALEGALKP